MSVTSAVLSSQRRASSVSPSTLIRAVARDRPVTSASKRA
jgi:hypothetical protein